MRITPRRKLIIFVSAFCVALLLGLAVGVAFRFWRAGRLGGSEAAVQLPVRQAPENATALDLSSVDTPPAAAMWLDVHDPAKARQALAANAWLQQVLQEPLGQGFLGSWAGFLGTRGEELQAQFTGTVRDLVADRLLAAPFRLLWFTGDAASGATALVVPAANATVAGAYGLLDGIATRGGYTASRCPGEPEPAAAADGAPSAPGYVISKWTLADHSVYAVARGTTLVVSRHPLTALQGICARLEPMKPVPGHDLELAAAPAALGRETQVLGQLLGLGASARLGFGIEGTQVVPRGISGPLAAPGMLAGEAPPESLLKLIPADMPVTLLAGLRLPAKLDAESLKAHFESKGKGELVARQAALLWRPHGDGSQTEIALLWPRAEDEDGLASIFSGGGNQLLIRKSCGVLVAASTKELADQVDAACNGREPSMRHAGGAVVEGLAARSSLAVGVNLGKLLSELLVEGHLSARGAPPGGALPPEIEEARRRLEELPYMGLRGLVEGAALVPGGFRS